MNKAVIMAGGFGTRLRPITMNLPKPMVPMMNVPMMEHIVNLLKRHSITDIMSLLYFQPEKITSYFGNGERFGISMKYMQAPADYGTAGAVRYAKEHLDERFIIISGDVLTDFDISKAIEFHKEKGAKATIMLTRSQNPLAFGIVLTDADGKINRFLEKPSWGEVFSDTINTGIYILEPEVMDLIPYQKDFDFSKDLFPLMLKNGLPLYGYIAEGYWQDVGNLEQYQQAHLDSLQGKVFVEVRGTKRGSSYIADSAKVHESAKLTGFVVVGENVEIGPYANITDSVIGAGSIIGNAVKIENSVLWERVKVGDFAELSADVIANDTIIGSHSAIAENVFIAHSCQIGDFAELKSNIKLWPNKVVESRAILSRSLVQEEKWLRELFADARVTGTANIEMNPEFGAKFGAALGNAFGANTTVIASRDAYEVSRMVKRSILAGLMSVGVSIVDLQTTALPLTRQALHEGRGVAGFHIRRSPYYPDQIDIIVLNAEGRDLQTAGAKKIERLFFGEDIKRVQPDDVGKIMYSERATEQYGARFRNSLNTQVIQDRKFNIVVDYANGLTAVIFPQILGELDCNVVGLNGYADSQKTTRGDVQIKSAQDQMSKVIASLKYEIGFILDPAGEKIYIVDSNGKWFSPEHILDVTTKLFLETHKHLEPYTIAVSVAASNAIEDMAKEHNVTVKRIQNSHSAMMEATRDKNVLFVGDVRGRFIFSEFFFASDSMFSAGKILEMLALSGKTIADIEAVLPQKHQHHELISCPWEKKGYLMRRAMEYSDGKERELIDGVKIIDGDKWVLMLPDKERGNFHIITEANTERDALAFSKQYVMLTEKWLQE